MSLPIKVIQIDNEHAIVEMPGDPGLGERITAETTPGIGRAIKELVERYEQLEEGYKDLKEDCENNCY